MSNATPSIDTLIDILDAEGYDAKESRDGETVVVGFGKDGYVRVEPDYVHDGGEDEKPAARVTAPHSTRRRGKLQAEIRAALEEACIYAR